MLDLLCDLSGCLGGLQACASHMHAHACGHGRLMCKVQVVLLLPLLALHLCMAAKAGHQQQLSNRTCCACWQQAEQQSRCYTC